MTLAEKALKLYEVSINSKIEKDIRALSSGTIAGITGLRSNADIDSLQDAFADWAVNFDGRLKNWQDAWSTFVNDFDLEADKEGTTTPKEIKKKVLV